MKFLSSLTILICLISPAAVFADVDFDRFDQSMNLLLEEIATTTPQACNGGSTVLTNGTTIINCPTSGGPTCSDSEACICDTTVSNGHYVATNKCIKKPKKREAVSQF